MRLETALYKDSTYNQAVLLTIIIIEIILLLWIYLDYLLLN